ncbi:hypothetical protein A1351_09345 [Methylosinus sp. R-45379]|uniref:transketolase family protein n=1 Tax=Methylosinus sp. R-45379 TaxID=980563 RepID=UPI0007C8C228|nr:transketolase C-terminal domain-containing protein [Methylosinus sp. R-45379]OAI30406.1 hypothetical protein A1351_09345 [Methylosinus sp. R-45379]
MRKRIIELIEADASVDPRIVFLTGDLGFSFVEPLEQALGERFVNMGVAEANMVSVAASLAASGFRPFAYSIAPFMTARCLEQIRNDICYQRRAVRLIGVGAGFSYGTLGPSHHALEDATIMAALPDLVVANPGNAAELDRCYAALLDDPRPAYFRIARESGASYGAPIFSPQTAAFAARRGADVTLAASGGSVTQCLAAAEALAGEGVEAAVVSVPIVQPFPTEAFAALLTGAPVVSVFEGYRGNPLSVGVMEALLARGMGEAFVDLTAPQAFPSLVGDTETLRRRAGLDPAAIAAQARALIAGRGARKIGARA